MKNPIRLFALSPLLYLIAFCLPTRAQPAAQSPSRHSPWFGIRVVDEQTGRGIPLATLTTTNHITQVTDSAGYAAFSEPGLMDREVWFHVRSPGYEGQKDGFGYVGARFTPRAGKTGVIKLKRTQIAERLYRLTGQGIYRDTELLNLLEPSFAGWGVTGSGVLGQDSVQAVPYLGRLFWLWGDTTLAPYPLGIFQVTAAWSDLPARGGMDPLVGVRYHYLMEPPMDPQKPDQPRKAAPVSEPGVVWLFGLLTVPDENRRERLIAHYSRRKSLTEELEHGLMVFNDERGVFERLVVFDLARSWQIPRGNAVRSGDWFYFAAPFCYTRVRATLADLKNQDRYQALRWNPSGGSYTWQSALPPHRAKRGTDPAQGGQAPPGESALSATARPGVRLELPG